MNDEGLNFNTLPNPTDRYKLDKLVGWGIFGQVYRARDHQASGRAVAVKMRLLDQNTERAVQNEYQILRDTTAHPNIADFYGVFCERCSDGNKIWFILELCEGGSAIELVLKLKVSDKKMREEHIAFILKETIKALIYLHDSKVMHRNVRSSNILLTNHGEVKISDFGLSVRLEETLGKSTTVIGSPSWMAPEVVTSGQAGYDNRADVWALGITAIELAEGQAPFQDMHPTRTLFQIVRNPPPGFLKPSSWSNDFNDFISECLEKNPEQRPFIMELLEHPFIQIIPENSHHLTQELRKLLADVSCVEVPNSSRIPERIVNNGLLVSETKPEPEAMQVEDLAALEVLSEDAINKELNIKLKKNAFTSFVGDVLLIVNPNIDYDIYNEGYHKKYECKSRSDNEPHIFAVADSAYQDALHHDEPQHIVFSGESGSGKSVNASHAVRHLTYIGRMNNNTAERIDKATSVIRVATHATTPCNANSTRCIMQTQVTYGASGKLSGAIFCVYLLEKWRISSTDMSQANFNLVYYFYDAKESENKLMDHHLDKAHNHRYLRIPEDNIITKNGTRHNVKNNIHKYKEFVSNLKDLEFEVNDLVVVENIISAILVLGNVRFKEGRDGCAEIQNLEEAVKVSKLLEVGEKKFLWALLNYCFVVKGSVLKKRHTPDEARDARDILASTLYKRLVDWLVNTINFKLSFGRSVFGEKYCVNVMDMFGFECFHRNRLEQLIVNTINEQMQFLYNQRMFAWEMMEEEEEQVPVVSLHFYDNKTSVDQLMGRPFGFFYILDEASRTSESLEFMMRTIKTKSKGPFLKHSGNHEFTVAHYTGKISYDAREMSDKNKDFLPPEMIETLRGSGSSVLQYMFTNKLTKSGNLTVPSTQPKIGTNKLNTEKGVDNQKTRKFNTGSKGQYSQLHCMRTVSATFRATSLELMKQLSIGPGSGGTHFVRCIRPDLADKPKGFNTEVVKQQVRALAILDTAKARQRGYSSRIPFAEFIRSESTKSRKATSRIFPDICIDSLEIREKGRFNNIYESKYLVTEGLKLKAPKTFIVPYIYCWVKRYKFLAFDFGENVEVTRDNCRLLLIRLKMEGWIIGNTKVFLKYYNVEFLSRLYEVQVKKIVKVQCMMRLFLARRKAVKNKAKTLHMQSLYKQKSLGPDEGDAALKIQTAYRGYTVRKAYHPLNNKLTGDIDKKTATFIRRYAMKWKNKSIFQVLLQYRAVRYQDLVNFSQQVHIYNQELMEALVNSNTLVKSGKIDLYTKAQDFLGLASPTVWKLPFRMGEIQYFDSSNVCDPSILCSDAFSNYIDSDQENWDEPLQRSLSSSAVRQLSSLPQMYIPQTENISNMEVTSESLINMPFCRDPTQPIRILPAETSASRELPARAPATEHVVHRPRTAPVLQGQQHYHKPDPNSSISYKKKSHESYGSPLKTCNYQPPTPWSSQKYTGEKVVKNDTLKKIDRSRSVYGIHIEDDRNNPVKELREMAKSTSAINTSEDDPPFNFQAMLKKTHRNRASMKRSGESETTIFKHEAQTDKGLGHRKGKAPSRPHTSQDLQPMMSQDLHPMVSQDLQPMPSQDFQPMLSQDFQPKLATDSTHKQTVELAPGITVAGVIVDL